MNKALIFFAATVSIMVAPAARGAVAVKKAAPVEAQSASGTSGAASLLPAVMNLVSNVQQLNAKQKALTAECVPSNAEINFVNNTMKEWAKTGAMSADDVVRQLHRTPCSGGRGYEMAVRQYAGTDMMDSICFDNFATDSDKDMVWYKFPIVGNASYCADGSYSGCAAKDKKQVSDIYEIFNLIEFSEADYTRQEATMAAKLIAKIENCSSAKLSAKKKALWGEFITDTLGSVGQPTNTGAIMQAVGGISGGGSMSSIGSLAGQLLNK